MSYDVKLEFIFLDLQTYKQNQSQKSSIIVLSKCRLKTVFVFVNN